MGPRDIMPANRDAHRIRQSIARDAWELHLSSDEDHPANLVNLLLRSAYFEIMYVAADADVLVSATTRQTERASRGIGVSHGAAAPEVFEITFEFLGGAVAGGIAWDLIKGAIRGFVDYWAEDTDGHVQPPVPFTVERAREFLSNRFAVACESLELIEVRDRSEESPAQCIFLTKRHLYTVTEVDSTGLVLHGHKDDRRQAADDG